MIFIDIEKAFDSVCKYDIFELLIARKSCVSSSFKQNLSILGSELNAG